MPTEEEGVCQVLGKPCCRVRESE